MSKDKENFRQVIAMYLVSVILVYIFLASYYYIFSCSECIIKKSLYNIILALMFMSLFLFLRTEHAFKVRVTCVCN